MARVMITDIKQGDVLEVTKTYPDNYFDAMLSDPPYGLVFMGKQWDKGVPSCEVWQEVLRIMKPGAWCKVFGGTRTWHRLAVALEDAGFEIKDTLMWLHGMGFPKSFDISKGIDKEAGIIRGQAGEPIRRGESFGQEYERNPKEDPTTSAAKQWQGYGTALKPAWEPILLIRKPLDKNNVNNALQWGTGGLNIDGGRLPTREDLGRLNNDDNGIFGIGKGANGQYGKPLENQGRWPSNVILDEESAGMLDDMSGERPSGGGFKGSQRQMNTFRGFTGDSPNASIGGDSGGASRFFYCAKASSGERNTGAMELYWEKDNTQFSGVKEVSREHWEWLGQEEERIYKETGKRVILRTRANIHSTVKPLSLNKYLATLLLPPPRENTTNGNARKLFVPFCGSGSEMIGALQAGWDSVYGIEIDPEYIKIANARIAYAVKQERNKYPLFAGVVW